MMPGRRFARIVTFLVAAMIIASLVLSAIALPFTD